MTPSSRRRTAALGAALFAVVVAGAGAADAALLPQGWFLTADALYGWRTVGGQGEPIVVPLGGPTPSYAIGGIVPNGVAAADLHLGYDGPAWGVEARYLGGFRWHGSEDLGSGSFRLANLLFKSTDVVASVGSAFDSGEINVRYTPRPDFTAFAGVRAIRWNDMFQADISSSAVVMTFDARTTAFGPQLGFEQRFSFRNAIEYEVAYVQFDMRGGVLFENTHQNFTFASGGPPTTDGSSGNAPSAFFEGGLAVGHRIGPFNIEGGYRVFYVDRIPTGEGYAADATASLLTNTAPNGRSLLIQALTFGVRARF